jgi:lysophospholipase L1-like esterase
VRLPERAKGLLVSVLALVLTGLAAEAALRSIGYTPRRAQGARRLSDDERRVALDCYEDDRGGRLGIDLRDPATRARYEAQGVSGIEAAAASHPFAVEYRYNSLGFRDAEIGPKREGVRRVLVLGDSFTEGQGVAESDAYPRVLERLLDAQKAGGWEVRNCGRRGADFPKLYERFEALLSLSPDVVVYGMVLNDADQSPEFRARQRYLDDWILDRRHEAEGAPPAPPLFRLLAFVADRVERLRVGRETTRWYHEMYGEPNREGWDRTQRFLRIMNRTMQRRGGALLVAQWPLLVGLQGTYPFAEPTAAIARACDDAGIRRVDLLEVLRGRPESSLWVSPIDRHPNELAHKLAAEALARVVRELRLPASARH